MLCSYAELSFLFLLFLTIFMNQNLYLVFIWSSELSWREVSNQNDGFPKLSAMRLRGLIAITPSVKSGLVFYQKVTRSGMLVITNFSLLLSVQDSKNIIAFDLEICKLNKHVNISILNQNYGIMWHLLWTIPIQLNKAFLIS